MCHSLFGTAGRSLTLDYAGKMCIRDRRTEEALTEQIADTRSEIEHLESVSNALDIALAESDLAQIKEELMAVSYTHLITVSARESQINICSRISNTPPRSISSKMIMIIWETVLNLPQ